jgi:murein hydrolase activator
MRTIADPRNLCGVLVLAAAIGLAAFVVAQDAPVGISPGGTTPAEAAQGTMVNPPQANAAAGANAAADPVRDQDNAARLEKVRAEIKRQQDLIRNLNAQAADARRDNEGITQEIEATQRLVGGMVRKESLLLSESRRLEDELSHRVDTYEGRKIALARSLRRMYVRGQRHDLEMVLTATSFSDLMSRVKCERTLARLNAGLVERTRDEGQAVVRERHDLDAALSEIRQTREERAQQAARLEGLQAEQVASLRELDDRRRGVNNRLLELSRNEQRLIEVLDGLEDRRRQEAPEVAIGQTEPLAELAGRLEWPVRGEVLRAFGRSVHPRFKTVTLNNGINISASVGAPVAAVGAGTVEFSDNLPGFGRCVILDHGEGYYTLYAYLNGVFVARGSRVAQGQVIAEVGGPGGGEPPQLYFEVRHGRTPLDPADWLRSR